MGQQHSSEKSSASKPGTAPQADKDRRINRRVSIQALSQSRSSPVDPSATKDTAVAQTTSQYLERPALQQYLQAASPEQHARLPKIEKSTSRASEKKKDELEHRPRTQTPVPEPGTSGPMDVPVARSKPEAIEERFDDQPNAYQDRRFNPVSQLRPPRLPLPIADATIPDSPALLPVDRSNTDVPIFETDEPLSAIDPQITRKSSMLSTTTESEDDVGDELQPFPVEGSARTQTIPTVIEWNHGGRTVFVTGTFANWNMKYKLHQR